MVAFVAGAAGVGGSEDGNPAPAGPLHADQRSLCLESSRPGCGRADGSTVALAPLRLRRAGTEFTPDGRPDPPFDVVVPMSAGGIGCPPGFEQLLRFLVKQLWIKVLPNQLQHRLSQLLVAAEIEDHIHGELSGQTPSTVWDHSENLVAQ